jgi:hypothetical protein
MNDPAKCFQYLSENVPLWIATLDELQAKIKARQPNLSRVPVPMRKVKKTGSSESMRTKSSGDGDGDGDGGGGGGYSGGPRRNDDVASAPQDGDIASALEDQHMTANQRKRKTASIISFSTTPTKYRARNMIVVYYDSDIQKSFEQVVRNIGAGRNNIRKTRLAQRMEGLTSRRQLDTLDTLRAATRLARRTATTREADAAAAATTTTAATAAAGAPMPNATPENEAYATLDAALEKAQSMCERGAHQFLREGDCETEIVGAKENFEEVKRVSDKELERLREASEQEMHGQDEADDRMSVEQESFSDNGMLEVDDDEDGGGFEEMMSSFRRVRQTQRS